MPNPYESPIVAPLTVVSRPNFKLLGRRAVSSLLVGYPLLLLGCLYGCWLLAWFVLGHPPRPSLDDPTSISPWVTVPYFATGLLLVAFPLGLCGGLAAVALSRRSLMRRAILAIVLLGVWLAVFALIRWDPLNVGYWYMD